MKYELTEYSDLKSFDAYLASLSSPIESFLEDHILQSAFHRIVRDGSEIGFFAIHNDSLLTQFHIIGGARRRGGELFADILEQYKPTAALVATCDEFFLSHALDKHATLKKQAFVFVDGGGEVDSDSKHARLEYRPAVQSDIPALRAIKNSIIDDPQEQIDKREVHVGYLGDELAAIGLIIPSSLWPDRASIGMLTQESLRRKGIGTKTILYLKRVCRDSGIMPLAGCGYGNTNSRMTLQAAGMVTQTRLLRLTF